METQTGTEKSSPLTSSEEPEPSSHSAFPHPNGVGGGGRRHPRSLLLQVDGASRRHGAPILGDDGQVGRPVVLRDKVLGLVVLVGVGGVVRDPATDVVSKVVGGHVVD